MENKIRFIRKAVSSIGASKIFCIAVQRTGTTSVGRFFKEHNYHVAPFGTSHRNDWTASWFRGDYESIFKSRDFRLNQVFEDDPWWCPEFYKLLFHKFPNSKFVLVERDADKWFESMIRHSGGKTPGNTHIHSMIYQREEEFYSSELYKEHSYSPNYNDNLLPLDESHREHYVKWYKYRNLEVKSFFDQFGEDRLVNVMLEDPEKWLKIGAFFNMKVDKDFDVHVNRVTKS